MLTSTCHSAVSNMVLVGFLISDCIPSKLCAPDGDLSSHKLSMKCLHSLLSFHVYDVIIGVDALCYFSTLFIATTIVAKMLHPPWFLNGEKKRMGLVLF